jgi:hypothetical protein
MSNEMGSQPTKRQPFDGLLESAWMGGAGLVLMAAALKSAVFASATALFWIVLVAASLCAVAAIATNYVARQDDLAELGLMSGFTFALSVLPLVHGITTPGVLFGPNVATMSSVLWATPVAAVAILPLAFPRTRLAMFVLAHWKRSVSTYIFVVSALSTGLLIQPSLLPAFPMGSLRAYVVAVVSLVVCLFLSNRHLRFARIARSKEPLAVSIGFVFIGLSNLVWLAPQPFAPLFWMAHLLDIVGVFVLTLIAMRA